MTRRVLVLIVLALVLPAAPAAAQSLNQQGVDRLNLDAQTLWAQDGVPMARQAASDALQKLVGVPHPVNEKTTATITRINSWSLDAPVAPGVIELNQQRLKAALPLSGTWKVSASADLYVKGRILGIKVDRTYTINIEVKDIRAVAQSDFDMSDPSAPKIAHVYPLFLDFNVKVTTSSWVLNALLWLTRSTVNGLAHDVAAIGGVYLAHKLNLQADTIVSVVCAGGPGLPPVPVDPVKLQQYANQFEGEIERFRTPYGPIIEPHFDKDYYGTWRQSLEDPGFDPGNRNGFHAWGDSGEMTGVYLQTLGYRWATTRDPAALDQAKKVLATMRSLLTMRGEPGNMNRSIMPLSANWIDPNAPYVPGKDYVGKWNGQDYIFCDYMSRDEYCGCFTGLAGAYDLFADQPDMRDSAKTSIEMALDYLLLHNWTWRRKDGGFGERWQGSLEQQYAWVLCGWHVNPAKYAFQRQQYRGYADLVWTGTWISCADPVLYDYYKFQLNAMTYDCLLRLETDPVLWQRAYQGLAIQRHFIGHHLNGFFDLVYLAHDASARAKLGPEVTNLITRWLDMPRRAIRIDITNDPTVEKTDFTLPVDGNFNPTPTTVKIAKYPLPPDKRIREGYIWSASPVHLKYNYPSNPDPYIEGETLDYVQPYWMGRYYGVVPFPWIRRDMPVRQGSLGGR